MGRVFVWAFAVIIGLIGICHMGVAIMIVISGNFAISPTTVSFDTFESDGFPKSGYWEITGGFVVPSYRTLDFRGKQEMELLPGLAHLVSDSAQADWIKNRKWGELSDYPHEGLLIALDRKGLAKIWPETAGDLSTIDPFDLPPVPMPVVGEVDSFEYSTYSDATSEQAGDPNSDKEIAHFMRFEEHAYGP